ncbi:DegT/DnrJ/EryC1/StrS family aminotransferase [Pseudonocardia sp. EC080625-04]|uniref:DegT/DnrJ/EryC1/StrS family aminotransferase n=1 Tax=Pseudonocardia sp. EC080625-04 TaxID=1096868 RepID=UPI000761E9F6|nr:DegT/DnrJ/EryC1/StrS family aminotransferase [Pseudonocardia sp. EC080625-04]
MPVLVDINPDTWCLDVSAAEAAITPRTRAVTVVHVYSAVADLTGLRELADRYGLPLIEDCAHAHGAAYRYRPVGGHGVAGVFSMQGSKLLTSGEGGAVVTDDDELAHRAEALRGDGRVRRPGPINCGEMELVETGRLMGANAALSEFHAAVLIDQLDLLATQNAQRASNAARLDRGLSAYGARPQATSDGTTVRAYYRYAVQLPGVVIAARPVDDIAAELTTSLGFPVLRTHPPLSRCRLLDPATRPRFSGRRDYLARVDPTRFELPVCHSVHNSVLSFGHEILLAPAEAMDEIVDAFREILTLC